MDTLSPKPTNLHRTSTQASYQSGTSATGDDWEVSLDESHIKAMKSKLSSKDFVLTALKAMKLVPTENESFIDAVASAMQLTVYKPGDLVREVNTAQHELLLVYKGQLQAYSAANEELCTLGPGALLGEGSLAVTDRTYVARYASKTPLELFSLPGADFEGIARDAGVFDNMHKLTDQQVRAEKLFAEMPIMKDCHRLFPRAIARHFIPCTFQPGDTIIQQGEVGKEMYIVLQGTVETVTADGTVTKEDTEPACHGENALLKNARRTVSLRAKEDVIACKITQSDYEEVLGQFEGYREIILAAEHERLNNRTDTLPLHMAARTGQEVFVEKVLSKGKGKAMVNIPDDLGWTALHEAVHGDHLHICKYLAKKGASLEEKNGEGNTPLHLAAMDGHLDILKWLCGLGVDVEVRNEDDSTPLHMAARCGVVECCQALIDNGAVANSTDLEGNTPLHFGANVGQAKCVELLISKGAKVNQVNASKETPLHQGALSDSYDTIMALLNAGADINAVDADGATPLQFGANVSAVNSCKALLKKKANPNARDVNGHIPLHHAAFNGSMECVKLMLKYGAQKTTKGNDGMTPYMFAELGGYDDIAKILYFYESPLVLAIRADDYDEAERLIAAGTDVNRNENDPEDLWTPMHEACARGGNHFVDLLLNNGALIDSLNDEDMTPLHTAAANGHAHTVEHMLGIGVENSIHARDKNGRVPFHHAVKEGHWQVAAPLLQYMTEFDKEDNLGKLPEQYAAEKGLDAEGWQQLLRNLPAPYRVRRGCKDKIERWVREGAEDIVNGVDPGPKYSGLSVDEQLNYSDSHGQSSLHWATYGKFQEGIDILLEHGANPNVQDENGYTPLHHAATVDNPTAVRSLLKHNADKKLSNSEGMIPRSVGVDYGHEEVVALLTDDPGHLIKAVRAQDIDLTREKIEDGADKEYRDPESGLAALHYAVGEDFAERPDFAELLLAEGAQVNTKSEHGLSALHMAASQGSEQFTSILLANKANPNLVGKEGYTPLHSAASNGHAGVLGMLTEESLNANLDAVTHDGNTPIHLAATAGSLPSVTRLLDQGADKHPENNDGHTPYRLAVAGSHGAVAVELAPDDALINAVKSGQIPEAMLLVENGYPPNEADDTDGSTALHLASTLANNPALIRALGAANADVVPRDNSGLTPLLAAAQSGNTACGEALVDIGAKLGETVPETNHNAFHLAAHLDHSDFIRGLGAREGAADVVNSVDAAGSTPLHTAAFAGSVEAVKALLEVQASKSVQDGNGNIPYQVAVAAGHMECAKLLAPGDALHQAVRAKDISLVKSLLDGGANVNDRAGEASQTPLHIACQLDLGDIAQVLISAGANVDIQDASKSTPLHVCALAGSAHCSALLLENKATVDALDAQGSTPLMLAAANAPAAITTALVQAQADVLRTDASGWTPLHYAGDAGACDNIRALLSNGAVKSDKNKDGAIPYDLAVAQGHDEAAALLADGAALIEAVIQDDFESASKLLENGCDVNMRDEQQLSSLHHACLSGNVRMSELLLKHGANVEAVDNDKRKPLHCAAGTESGACVKVVCEGGANVNSTDAEGRSALLLASRHGPANIVQYLLSSTDADHHATDASGETALHAAGDAGRADNVQVLLDDGLSREDKSKAGKIPYDLAVAQGHSECARLLNPDQLALITAVRANDVATVKKLLDEGSDINQRDDDGLTGLHHACLLGYVEVADVLLGRGANVEAVDNDKRKPLHCAAGTESGACVKVVCEGGAKVNSTDAHGATALHLVAARGPADVLGFLLSEAGSNAQATDAKGNTALHSAGGTGRIDNCQTLLEHGCERTDQNKAGEIPYVLALRGEHDECARLLNPDADALITAAKQDDRSEVETLVRIGFDPGHKDASGMTALHYAAQLGFDEMIRTLVHLGARVNPTNAEKNTPLHLAAGTGQLAACQALLDNGGKVTAKDISGASPLHAAATGNHGQVCTLLMENGAKPRVVDALGETPLHAAAHTGGEDAVVALLAVDEDKKVKAKDGRIPYQIALANGHEQCAALLNPNDGELIEATIAHDIARVEALLHKGVDVNVLDDVGMSALHHAARLDFVDIAEVLVSSGARFNSADNQGLSPLHRAACASQGTCVRYLVQQGASVSAVTPEGSTPLHLSVAHASLPEATHALLKKGADVSAIDEQGWTPLHYCAEHNRVDIIPTMLEFNASRTATTKDGDRPYDLALAKDYKEAALLLNPDKYALITAARAGDVAGVEHLLKLGVDVAIADQKGITALHAAIEGKYNEIAEKLLAAGASPDAPDADMRTPLHVGALINNKEGADLLLDYNATPSLVDSAGNTALHVGAQNIEVMESLLNADPEHIVIDTPNTAGQTALHLTAIEGNTRTTARLLQAGASKAVEDLSGSLPYDLAHRRGHTQTAALLADLDALKKAVLHNDLETVETLLSVGHDPNHADSSGRTPVMYAGKKGYVRILESLLEAKGDHNQIDHDGRTTMFYAAEHGHVDACRALRTQGARVNVTDKNGDTPLHLSTRNNHVIVSRYLLGEESNANTQNKNGESPLHIAADTGDVQHVKDLLSYEASKTLINRQRETPYRVAVRQFNHEAAALLATDSVLIDAVIAEDTNLVRYWLDRGAKTGYQDDDGNTALHHAIRIDNVEITKMLLAKGASTRVQNKNGETPLQMVTPQHETGHVLLTHTIKKDDLPGFNDLLERGANVNGAPAHTWAPIHEAVTGGRATMTDKLLSAGANPEAQSGNGRTALHLACKDGSVECAELLLKNRANVDARSGKQLAVPLHYAAHFAHVPIVQLLLDYKVHKDARDSRGKRPIDVVPDSDPGREVYRLLKDHRPRPWDVDMSARPPRPPNDTPGRRLEKVGGIAVQINRATRLRHRHIKDEHGDLTYLRVQPRADLNDRPKHDYLRRRYHKSAPARIRRTHYEEYDKYWQAIRDAKNIVGHIPQLALDAMQGKELPMDPQQNKRGYQSARDIVESARMMLINSPRSTREQRKLSM